jgi:CheY-like chemotaxis protein
MSSLKPILYIEDDDNDVFLMERALKKVSIANPLRVLGDGKQAIEYLSSHRGEEPPAIVMLDLSMPGKHGLEVLQWIRSQPGLSTVPVVVLTSSNQEKDIHRAYLLGANGYLIKPGDPNDLIRLLGNVRSYWLSDNVPPGPFLDVSAVQKPRTVAET